MTGGRAGMSGFRWKGGVLRERRVPWLECDLGSFIVLVIGVGTVSLFAFGGF